MLLLSVFLKEPLTRDCQPCLLMPCAPNFLILCRMIYTFCRARHPDWLQTWSCSFSFSPCRVVIRVGPVDLPLYSDLRPTMPPLPSHLVIVSAFNTLHFGIIKEACPSCAPQLLLFFFSDVYVCVWFITLPLSERMVGGAVAWLCLPCREGISPHSFVVVCLPTGGAPWR